MKPFTHIPKVLFPSLGALIIGLSLIGCGESEPQAEKPDDPLTEQAAHQQQWTSYANVEQEAKELAKKSLQYGSESSALGGMMQKSLLEKASTQALLRLLQEKVDGLYRKQSQGDPFQHIFNPNSLAEEILSREVSEEEREQVESGLNQIEAYHERLMRPYLENSGTNPTTPQNETIE